LRGQLDEVRSLLPERTPFGVNVFAPPGHGGDADQVALYAQRLADEAARSGAALGTPGWDDDHFSDKVELLTREAVPVVSFTFGCPATGDVQRLQDAGSAVWVTVTKPAEALLAQSAGADALVVQGVEAGGHRGSFDDAEPGDIGLLALLQLVRAAVGDSLPLIASGGLGTGAGVAGALAAGAAAAQLGTAFMLCPEAGTAASHREAINRWRSTTALTRAYTGRTARGIENRFLRTFSDSAPSAYPEVHHLTAPIRAAAREHGDADGFHLWAGQTYPLAEPLPAAELVDRLGRQARAALADATRRFG
jgi:nitronate monooxygenase